MQLQLKLILITPLASLLRKKLKKISQSWLFLNSACYLTQRLLRKKSHKIFDKVRIISEGVFMLMPVCFHNFFWKCKVNLTLTIMCIKNILWKCRSMHIKTYVNNFRKYLSHLLFYFDAKFWRWKNFINIL